MSSSIRVCPHCRALLAMTELPEATRLVLTALVCHAKLNLDKWQAQAWYCPHCECPSLVIWPGEFSLEARRELLADAGAPLKITGETGGKR